jgi:hypothetical protein
VRKPKSYAIVVRNGLSFQQRDLTQLSFVVYFAVKLWSNLSQISSEERYPCSGHCDL